MKTAFKMKSGNSPMFKHMGSSPMRTDWSDRKVDESKTEIEKDIEGRITKKTYFNKSGARLGSRDFGGKAPSDPGRSEIMQD